MLPWPLDSWWIHRTLISERWQHSFLNWGSQLQKKKITKTWQQWKVSKRIKPKTCSKSKRRWGWVSLGALAHTKQEVLKPSVAGSPHCHTKQLQPRFYTEQTPIAPCHHTHDTNKCLNSDLRLLNDFKTSVLLYMHRSLLLGKQNNLVIKKNRGLMFSYHRSSATKSEISTFLGCIVWECWL